MRILVVEDERELCQTIVRSLRRLAYSVDPCYDGDAAIALLGSERYDLVLLDLNMPDPGGLAVMEILARDLPDIHIIVVTADIQETTRVRCLVLGARDFLNKPVDPAALRQALEALI